MVSWVVTRTSCFLQLQAVVEAIRCTGPKTDRVQGAAGPPEGTHLSLSHSTFTLFPISIRGRLQIRERPACPCHSCCPPPTGPPVTSNHTPRITEPTHPPTLSNMDLPNASSNPPSSSCSSDDHDQDWEVVSSPSTPPKKPTTRPISEVPRAATPEPTMPGWKDEYLTALLDAERSNPVSFDLVEACT